MDKDRGNAGLLEPGLEAPQNRFGSFEVVSISGLENDIGFRGQLLQVRNIIEGSKNRLESQFFKALSLLGRAKVDSDLVLGFFGVLDEMSEDSASNVTWSIQTGDKHSAIDNGIPQMVRRSAYQ